MIEIRHDMEHLKVIRKLIRMAIKADWTPTWVRDGVERFSFKTESEALEVISSTGEGSITFQKGDHGVTCYFLLCNLPEETMYDLGANSEAAFDLFSTEVDDPFGDWLDKKFNQ